MHAWCRRQPWRTLLPETFQLALVLTDDGRQEYVGKHSCVLLHKTLFDDPHFPELFKDRFLGNPGDLRKCWLDTAASSAGLFEHHPVQEVRNRPDVAVPVCFYGDDDGVFGTQQQLCTFWGGVAVRN